ncbi:13409_t:CDS:1, partial [Dentiscutata heterogama]
MLNHITTGLNAIHKAGLVHDDLHIGNILHDDHEGTNITALPSFKQI